jgi:ankyrin repeat protein
MFMFTRDACVAMLLGCVFSSALNGQTTAKVDFGRDVQPIFRQSCVGCHGPSQQISNLRLDRRSSVFRAGARRIVPGSSENSFLYYRLIGNDFGLQMPPTGPLRPEQINLIKAWIDQGAEWPDALANEADVPPLNSAAIEIVEKLRTGDRQSFLKLIAEDPKLLNARGPQGSTPFMYAVLYSDVATLAELLKKGANPNARNDVNATALMWAATDLAKTQLLLAHGAEVNIVSNDSRTALMAAAARPGGAPVIKALLDRGADPNPKTLSPPLIEAAIAGDAESMQLLLARGAEVNPPPLGAGLLTLSARAKCAKCIDLLIAKNLSPAAYTGALRFIPALGDVNLVRMMLDRGADPNAVDPLGRTPLMSAVLSDFPSLDVVKLLVEQGGNVNARSQHKESGDSGRTVLDLAKLRGNTPIVDLLIKSGASATAPSLSVLRPQRGSTIQAAIQRSLPLLQRTDASFISKAGCVSCHNDSLQAMAVGLARKSGFSVDEKVAVQQVKANVSFLEQKRDLMHQGFFFGAAQGDPAIASYILLGLDAEHYGPDLNTDAVAMFVKARQMPDGRWAFGTDGRPPLCADGDIGVTVLNMRALQLYAPAVDKPAYEKSIQLAAAWLGGVQPMNDDDRSWRLLGLAWAGKNKDAIQKAIRDLLAVQRSDGGWSDLQSLDSNAYSTGKALVALQASGMSVSDSAYQRGVQFLLNTQMADGSWYIKTRAAGLQPYFDNGFPHGIDQWISAAGTSWATMALTLASQSSAKPASVAEATRPSPSKR